MSHRAIFTHNDLDALSCALLARLAMPGCDVYFCDYAGFPDLLRARLGRYEAIWIADISLRPGDPLLAAMQESDAEILWFDHHDSSSAQPWMAESRLDHTGRFCSGDLVAQYLSELGVEIPLAFQTLLEWTRDQDLWLRALPESQVFNDILGNLHVQELFDLLSADPSRVYHPTERMSAASAATEREREWSLELARRTSVWHDLPGGGRLRACCCWGSVSEVGDALGDPDTLVALLDLRSLERRHARFSFRTQSDTLAANRIAERLGGGGHAKASGAPLAIEELQAISAALVAKVLGAAGAGDES
jgi:oligoribonuclease NrnB/cAMP/cGMP phosphodiesterase (DHH superfamily)